MLLEILKTFNRLIYKTKNHISSRPIWNFLLILAGGAVLR